MIIETSLSSAARSLLSRSRAWRYITQVEPGLIEVTEPHIPIRGLPETFAGLRVLQMSDIHIGSWVNLERLQKAVDMALQARPDITLLTGDYMPGYGWSDRARELLADLVTGLRPLAAAVPTFSILGNHDVRTNPEAIRAALAGIGVTDLTNKVFPLQKGSGKLYLAGVDDINRGTPRLDLVLEHLPADGPAILMAHEPDFADISAPTGRFALQVSGHTHGGQVVLPFIGAPLLPRNGQKYYSGLYKVGEMFQYTNRGIGTGYQRVRYNCRPEITVFVLEQAKE